IPYAQEVYNKLIDADIRCEKYFENEKLGYKIRQAQMQKIPYMLVIGDKEMAAGTVAPRARDGKNLGALSVDDFIALVQEMCKKKQ
ncbi:MAG: threonine--tRNA ligase, partial [Syntrophaceae bacterium]|nr:threonine--tRNA ligase [Syntrophaceae bacterium]